MGVVQIHHRPSLDAIFYHQVLGHRGGNLGHIAAVVFFTHARLAVAADGEAEISARLPGGFAHLFMQIRGVEI